MSYFLYFGGERNLRISKPDQLKLKPSAWPEGAKGQRIKYDFCNFGKPLKKKMIVIINFS